MQSHYSGSGRAQLRRSAAAVSGFASPGGFLLSPEHDLRSTSYRKHAVLGIKEQEAIQMRIQDWVERYLEVESLFP